MAFCSYILRHNVAFDWQAAAQSTIDDLFPVDEVTTDLDHTVVSLDRDLVDDYPASDPRWAESRQGEGFWSV